MSFLSRWGPGRLLLAWSGYWLAVLLAVIGPGLPTLWDVTREGAKGSASASVTNGVMQLRIVSEGASAWARDISLLSLSLWLAVPPLVLWLFWLRAQRRDRLSRQATP
jgi:hypothetical protein